MLGKNKSKLAIVLLAFTLFTAQGAAFSFSDFKFHFDTKVLGQEVENSTELAEQGELGDFEVVEPFEAKVDLGMLMSSVQDDTIHPSDSVEVCGTITYEDDDDGYITTDFYMYSPDFDFPEEGESHWETIEKNTEEEVCLDFTAPDSYGHYDIRMQRGQGVHRDDMGSDTFEVEEYIEPASADISYSATVDVGDTVDFDGTGSSGHGGVQSYTWYKGTERIGSGSTISYTFEEEGTYNIHLEIEDDEGQTDTATEEVIVNVIPPSPVIDVSVSEPEVGEEITLDGSDTLDGSYSIDSFEWIIGTDTVQGDTASYSFDEAGEQEVVLEVTDSEGNTETESVMVDVQALEEEDEEEDEQEEDEESDDEDVVDRDDPVERFIAWLVGFF